jgi:hypothetical protein
MANEEQNINCNFNRGTIILVKEEKRENSNLNNLIFMEGTLQLNEKDPLLSIDLTPGKYLIYCKFDQTT